MEYIKEIRKLWIGQPGTFPVFLEENPDADRFTVTLYGSLSKTGKGHMVKKNVHSGNTNWNRN